MPLALIALGSNLGDRRDNIRRAIQRLASHAAISVVSQSSLHGTAPAGGPSGQQDFVNAAVTVQTSLQPLALLQQMLLIETSLGRRRVQHWGPRTVDLDLLLFEDQVLALPDLVLPHPRMAHRRFVLEPAAETAPAMRHPVLGWTVAEMLQHINTSAPYYAITGATGCGKSTLMAAVASEGGLQRIDEPVDDASLTQYYGDPASAAQRVELQILKLRTELLHVNTQRAVAAGRSAVSDFWFNQALAFARIALSDDHFQQFQAEWRRAEQLVIKPRLVVVLQTQPAEVRQRIVQRGRKYQQHLSTTDIPELQRGIEQVAAACNTPRLMLDGANSDAARAELLATIAAMT